MPDIKHCGGLLEAEKIATIAELNGILVSPHNPSGPVSTAASASLCTALPNFDILEFQWGEASWRKELVAPAEEFRDGMLIPGEEPGFGVSLNHKLMEEHRLPA
jgi:galactonate dehydratase